MERFVTGSNMSRLVNRLYDECDPEKQRALQQSLLLEEHRFRVQSWHLELVQKHID
jgi:hypothetical protein